jgi:cytochrome c oxidase cbb3-type subunit III
MVRYRLFLMLAGSSLIPLARLPMPAQAGQSSGSSQGAQLYATNCAFCHAADGRGGRAPAIATLPQVIALPDQELVAIVHNGETDRGMPAFPGLGDQGARAVVGYLRALQGVMNAAAPVKLPGDPQTGRQLFFATARCSNCHTVEGEGGFMAQELTSYARNRKAHEILQAIVNPDANMDPAARVAEVRTRTGKRLTGAVRAEDNMNLTLQTVDGRYHFLTRDSLAAVNFTGHSLMPRDYGTQLTAQQLDDLVSFLIVTARNAPAEPAPENRKHGDDD